MLIRTAFLSSVCRELSVYRELAYDAIEGLDGWHCVRMEDFGARDWDADDFCRARVSDCDLLVLMLGFCYGSCPDESCTSYTQREYEAACRPPRKPCIVLLARDDYEPSAPVEEPDEWRARQRAFRERVSRERILDTFSSPEDLAWRVARAIHNWERDQERMERERAAGRPTMALPLPPQPYFVHPYPLQQDFTGRVRERAMLTRWLAEGTDQVMALIAIGGMGKSALTWVWALRDVIGLPVPGLPDGPADVSAQCRVPQHARPEGLLWWSFYDAEAGFGAFLDAALRYVGGGEVDPGASDCQHEKVHWLLQLLQDRRVLLVLDGFERELRAYHSLNAAYAGDLPAEEADVAGRVCIDPHAAQFLRGLAALPLQGRALITSRLFPHELDEAEGCHREDLPGMAPTDAVAFFHAQDVTGTRAEIEEICRPWDYHPLALRLLAGVVKRDKRNPGDIRAARRHLDEVLPDLTGTHGRHHVLQVAYDALDPDLRELLSRIAAFRGSVGYDAIGAVSPFADQDDLDPALDELVDRGLVMWEGGSFSLHPIVHRYAYDRLGGREHIHEQVRDYFAAMPEPDEVASIDDLMPTIELYHHTVRTGGLDDALRLYSERLSNDLYYRLGRYLTCIELLRELFPGGEDQPPRLTDPGAQAWVLNSLANAYSLVGQSRRAAMLYDMQIAIREEQGVLRSIAIGLCNLADDLVKLGALQDACAALRRSIDLAAQDKYHPGRGSAKSDLGWVLALTGAFEESEAQMHEAWEIFGALGQSQDQCVVASYRALRALLMGAPDEALVAAERALSLAQRVARRLYAHHRDFVRVGWLMGWTLIEMALTDSERRREHLAQAEQHLTDALVLCRRINMVDHEPDILLVWARWYRAMGDDAQAREAVNEALTIAQRCEYRLVQADAHNLLAELALDAGELDAAREYAEIAKERAWCDGPPYCYQPAVAAADRLLRRTRRAEG